MLLGPVFRAELLRSGRRRRYYVLRLVYGGVLWLLVWSAYESTFRGVSSASFERVAGFAEETFLSFAVVQLLTVLLLIPALFGGAIADEKQRKTLHYLMASQLSGGEIILDKVLGRAAHLAVFLAIGLPVICLLSLFGGVAAESVAVVYAGTCSTAVFAVALTVLVSTLARRVRQAVLVAYLLLLGWVLIPSTVDGFGSIIFPGIYVWIRPVNEWLKASGPLNLWAAMMFHRYGFRGGSDPFEVCLWMAGLQLGASLLLLLLAIWCLRPMFRRQESTPARRTWFSVGRKGRRPRWLARPECGDDAMLWKERYFAPSDLFTKLVLLPAIILATVPLGLFTLLEGDIGRLVSDFWNHGVWTGWSLDNLVWWLRVDLGWYTAFWLLAIAGGSAACVTIEREEDTWVSLTSTPLTGWQIVRGKVLGAIWNQRGFGAVLVLLWVFGLATGTLHPLGVLLSIGVVAMLTWFVAALGIHASLGARSTSRAIMATLVALCVWNGYPILLLLGFSRHLDWDASFALLGVLPWLSAGPLVSYPTAAQVWEVAGREGILAAAMITPAVIIGLALLPVYFAAAALLTWRVVTRFDQWLDRPRLADGASLQEPRAAHVEAEEPVLQS